jgi:hypothetical protein
LLAHYLDAQEEVGRKSNFSIITLDMAKYALYNDRGCDEGAGHSKSEKVSGKYGDKMTKPVTPYRLCLL